VPEPEASANDQEPRAAQPNEPWHDKVLVDAIGYTKGLVAILDSLSEGFQRRGRELDEQRARLAILQSERRTILQERADFDARITALTAERDSLRMALETRERELEDQRARLASLDDERRTSLQERADFDARITALTAERESLRTALETRAHELNELQQGTAQTQATLQAQTREIEALRADFDARITALTAERDSLRGAVEEHGQEINRLRRDGAVGQAALEAQTREMQALRDGMAEPTRQAEELREVVRSLERQLQRVGQLPARAPVTQVPRESAPAADGRMTPQLDAAAFDEMFSDQRRSEDERVAALTAERDSLRGAVEEHEQEINRLRQDGARGQAALEAQTREMQALRIGMAETVRQAEEIRKVLQALEGQVESAGRREAALEEALEAERRQLRETAVRTSQEHEALRVDLADAENLLAEARKDIGASQGMIAGLRRTVDDERAQSVALREQLEKQTADLARLQATMHAVPTLLNELVRAFGGGEEASVSASTAGRTDADVLAVLQAVREVCRDVVQLPTGSELQPPDLAINAAELRRRSDQIADRWRRVAQERDESARPAGPVRQEHAPRGEQGGPTVEVREVKPERPPRPAATQPPISTPAAPSSGGAKNVKRPGSPSGLTVECTFPASETEAACILRGEIARINDMGLLAAFEERLPEGVPMVVRFVRGGEVLSCLGRVVRVQESAGTSMASATLHHLIRFESSVSPAGENAPSSAN
jgi:predicted  nucleic acid-binding Zn-ribbon protein